MTRQTGDKLQGSFGEAFVNAVCCAAGYIATRPSLDSGHKIDFLVTGCGTDNTAMDQRLEIQVKSTFQPRLENGDARFGFDRSLYDWARKPNNLVYVPRIVVLLQVPENPTDWMTQTDDQLIAKHCAYWVSLRDKPELPASQDSTVVHFPLLQQFTVNTLVALMDNISLDRWP